MSRVVATTLGAWRPPRAGELLALLPAAVFLGCSVASDMVAIAGRDPVGAWRILPAGPVSGNWVGAEVSSTGLLLISLALVRGKRIGFWVALAALAGAVVQQGFHRGHPVAALAALAVAGILLATHRRYDVASPRREAAVVAALIAAGAVAAGVGGYVLANARDTFDAIAAAVGGFLDLATPNVPGVAAIAGLLVLTRVAYVIAAALVLDAAPDERSLEAVETAARALRSLGRGSLHPYQLDPACVPFADADGRGVLAYARAGRGAVALGDPVGRDAGTAALAAWVDHCRRRDLVPSIYQASRWWRDRLVADGWHACAVGQDAIVDPTAFDLRSPRLANTRHTVTRSRKGGLRTVWSAAGVPGLDPALRPELDRLDLEWRRRAGPQLALTVGRYDPEDRRPCGISVAVAEDGAPAAFAIVRPTGADGGWMLDVMRRADGAVPGAMEACLVTAIESLAAMGVGRLSLGLAPLSGLSWRAGPFEERLLALGARAIRPVYDTSGLAFFKAKFDPAWEPRYLVVRHRWSFPGAALALLRLHLGGSWPRVARSLGSGLVPARD